MAITQTMCTSFKKALLDGEMDFSANTNQAYKIALYTSSADLGAATAVYTTANEASGTNYVPGGRDLVITAPTTSGTTALLTFATVTWANVTVTARGALIYQVGGTTPAVAVLDFGTDKQATAGSFAIQFPTANADNAIIRIA
jgi:hypothetical protein|tara:strand:+ start:2693 stop:3121 length:429 start_codon:yes stop_codon:yes gene_type:complete